MFKPDVIVTWPKSCDYPLWRQFIRDNRHLFNEVIVVFMETNQGFDYRSFVREAMFRDHVLFVESPIVKANEDWRNVAINAALLQSLHSEWIWFTEQDFHPTNKFFAIVSGLMQTNAIAIGVKEGERLHPCSLFIRREILNKTNKFFGISSGVYDHFGKIQYDLDYLSRETGRPVAIINTDNYNHMAGLSHNMSLIERNEAPNHKKEEFDAYIKACHAVSVPLHDNWKNTFKILSSEPV